MCIGVSEHVQKKNEFLGKKNFIYLNFRKIMIIKVAPLCMIDK